MALNGLHCADVPMRNYSLTPKTLLYSIYLGRAVNRLYDKLHNTLKFYNKERVVQITARWSSNAGGATCAHSSPK